MTTLQRSISSILKLIHIQNLLFMIQRTFKTKVKRNCFFQQHSTGAVSTTVPRGPVSFRPAPPPLLPCENGFHIYRQADKIYRVFPFQNHLIRPWHNYKYFSQILLSATLTAPQHQRIQ
mgnify:CR=1 FL=1